MRQSLPNGYSLRHATKNDFTGISALTQVISQAVNDPLAAVSVEALNTYWEDPGCTIENDAWVVQTSEGQIVGYEEGYNRSQHAILNGEGYVHPDHEGKGIGTAMLRTLDVWAKNEMSKAQPDVRVLMRIGIGTYEESAKELLSNEGYQPIRYFWRMEIDQAQPPAVPAFPDGIELRPFLPNEHMRLVYEADEEAFQDHWGFVHTTFEQWLHRRTVEHPLDPALWHVAWDGEQIAGICLCRYRAELDNMGWVSILAVRPAWRKRGLGSALLQHAFADFYQRSNRKVGLGVDASNHSGATRLYENAGMQIAESYVTYEKEIRPGLEISVQSPNE